MEFQELLKARGTSTGFLFIPTGNANTERPYPYEYNLAYPKIKYQQGERNTCATSSIASCLHHLGFKDTAVWIEDFGKSFVADQTKDQHKIMNAMIFHVQQSIHEFTKNWNVQKIKVSEFDIWNDENRMNPKLLQILGSDGGVGHALTVYNGMIFDSNLEFAVDLTVLNLEFCIGAVYDGIVNGYMFLQRIEPTSSKKKIMKQRERTRQQKESMSQEPSSGKKRKRKSGRGKEARKRRQTIS
jgi:hypothetical protein